MNIRKTDDFERAFQKLPLFIKRLVAVQENRFLKNPRDPRLHIKKVQDLPPPQRYISQINVNILLY